MNRNDYLNSIGISPLFSQAIESRRILSSGSGQLIISQQTGKEMMGCGRVSPSKRVSRTAYRAFERPYTRTDPSRDVRLTAMEKSEARYRSF
jgi:hypothetical protein